MILIQLFLYALIAFRLSELLIIDDGPFEIFFNLRGWAGKPPLDTPVRGTISALLSCVHCIGFWISLLLGIVYYFSNSVTVLESILFALSVSGLQSILAGKLGRTSL